MRFVPGLCAAAATFAMAVPAAAANFVTYRISGTFLNATLTTSQGVTVLDGKGFTVSLRLNQDFIVTSGNQSSISGDGNQIGGSLSYQPAPGNFLTTDLAYGTDGSTSTVFKQDVDGANDDRLSFHVTGISSYFHLDLIETGRDLFTSPNLYSPSTITGLNLQGSVRSESDRLTEGTIIVNSIAATVVPEPATWAMMIGGFGLVGGAMRRKGQSRKAETA